MKGYEQFRETATSESELARLSRLADQQHEAELEVAQKEAELESARKRLADLSERQIPELMDTLRMEYFRTTSGFQVKIRKTVRASIPAARREEAYRWLDRHGFGGLVKRSVVVAFNREQEREAKLLEKQLGKAFENVKTDQKVEPSTLRAWIAEQLRGGGQVPLDLFGAWVQRTAEVKSTE